MSANETVSTILETRLKTEWGVTTPIWFDNVDYKPEEGTAYIKPSLEGTISENKGPSCTRKHYMFRIAVITPQGEGDSPNSILCDTLETIFEKFQSGNLSVQNARTERSGQDKEWFKRRVIIELFYDHFI